MEGLFPDLVEELKEFESMVTWKKIGTERIPEPARGIEEEFDAANDLVNDIKKQFTEILKNVRKQFNNDPNM